MKALLVICENHALVREGISKGQYDFSLGLNSTSQTFFQPINGE